MTDTNEYKGPLAGLNVIDFGHYYAGPMVGMMLADQGANVIRIVKPGEPELPSQQYRLLNRNKKLLTLDLKTEEGVGKAKSLIERADVVIENFRPGVMKRLGLDYAGFKTKNPRLVYLSLPGFASTDKERAQIQAWEGVMGAAACLYTQTSTVRQNLGYPPLYSWPPQCSMYGGMLGMLTVTVALAAREEEGVGTVIEVPMVDAAALCLFMKFLEISNRRSGANTSKAGIPDHLKPFAYDPQDSEQTQLDKLSKVAWEAFSSPTWRASLCADGRRVMHWPQGQPRMEESLLEALGIYDQLLQEGFVNAGPYVFGKDNNLCDPLGMKPERKQRLNQLIKEAFLAKTSEEWDTILGKAGVPSSLVRTREEWLALEPMLTSGVFAMMDDGKSALVTVGRIADVCGPDGSLMAPSFREPEPVSVATAEDLFQTTSEKASTGTELGLKKSDLLKGLKVLDLSNVAAGPVGGHFLALYGATVIKADQAEPPTIFYPMMVPPHSNINSGKRSILLDVKLESGRQVLEKLMCWADLVIHNSVDETAERLGVTHAQVQKINPKAVVCQISAFGGTYRGGWEHRVGFDPILQAASGLMTQYGTLENPQWYSNIASADIMGAFTIGISASLGVYQQRRTGYAGEARTSLARQIGYIQLPYMIAENGKSEWGEVSGQFAIGDSLWHRMYACRDGKWVFVGSGEERADELSRLVTGQSNADKGQMEAAFAEHDCHYWEATLQEANIGCHEVLCLESFLEKFPRREVDNEGAEEVATASSEILYWPNHPWRLPVTTLAPNYVRVGEEHSWCWRKQPGRIGGDAEEILQELGYNQTQIDELLRNQAVYDYMPQLGRKDIFFLGQEPPK